MSDLPIVNATLCTGCGDCVIACPASCLEMADNLPRLARPTDCVLCGICDAVCPAKAIQSPGTSVISAGGR